MTTTFATLRENNEQIALKEDALSTILQVVFVLATFVTIALLAASTQVFFN